MNKNYEILIIMYNQTCDTSETCTCLEKYKSIVNGNIFVFDNSTIKKYNDLNKLWCEERNIKYIPFNNNIGLSKAYNIALKQYLSNEIKWVVLFDQDTKISREYLECLNKEVLINDSMVKVPVVLDEVGLLSPSIIKKHHVYRATNLEQINSSNITAINTGMIINKDIYKCIGYYDEAFFLDYIDHNFIRNCKKFNHNIKVVNGNLYQNFSENSHDNFESDFKRFNILKKDLKIFCNDSFEGRVYFRLKILFKSIKLSIIYKKLFK